jgi:hypothetical protein
MLTRKKKFSYGPEEDLLLEESFPVPFSSSFITHVELYKTTNIPKGVYRYKPKAGVLAYINGDLCSIVQIANMKLFVASDCARFLYHKATFDEMLVNGEIIDNRSEEEKAQNPLRPEDAYSKEDVKKDSEKPKRRSLST